MSEISARDFLTDIKVHWEICWCKGADISDGERARAVKGEFLQELTFFEVTQE
jgi:hypothetical protein